jgi:predicted DNA-binding transcriptional regulator AlpA
MSQRRQMPREDEAKIIRTSRKSVYALTERGLLPAPIRFGRRILFRRVDLVRWLQERRAASSERSGR